MRLFLAIDLDDAARAEMSAEQTRLARTLGRSSLKFVKPDQLHVTLVFLGEIPEDRVTAVCGALETPPLGHPAFDAVFDRIGLFPPHGAPRVLWIGAGEGAAEMIALQHQLAARMAALGIDTDRRAFQPHLTLGRWRNARPRDRTALRDLPAARRAVRLHVDHVTLYHSQLSPSGSTYSPLAHATLESPP